MNGKMAISKAGHDEGKVYVIVGRENGSLLLADGIERTISNPKKKNFKHVSVLETETMQDLEQMISDKSRGCNEAIRQSLRHFIKKNPEYKIRK